MIARRRGRWVARSVLRALELAGEPLATRRKIKRVFRGRLTVPDGRSSTSDSGGFAVQRAGRPRRRHASAAALGAPLPAGGTLKSVSNKMNIIVDTPSDT